MGKLSRRALKNAYVYTMGLVLVEFTLTLIRGAKTELERDDLFLGRLNHPASRYCVEMLSSKTMRGEYPAAQVVFSSPLARSLESAHAIYPKAQIIELEQLTDFDYGVFAGKSYEEIVADKQFGIWTSSNVLTTIPGGESPYGFLNRCSRALWEIANYAKKNGLEKVSVVTHRLVIAAMLRQGDMPGCLYCDYRTSYGSAIVTTHKEGRGGLYVLKKL